MELDWINRLRLRPGSELIGDDAADLGDRVVTVDMLTEGVDFLLDKTDPKWIGRKALAVNLSDIAAMGAIPAEIVVALALPRQGDSLRLAERLYQGMEPLLERWDISLAGGDTNRWDGGLVLSITALGRVSHRGVLRRSGGKSGDAILSTGPFGGSILGRHFSFEPRIAEVLYLNEHFEIHAAIDVSDGLSLDVHRLATESKLGVNLFENSIPIAPAAVELSRQSGKPPLEHALSDGEDFELLLAVPQREAERLLETQPLREHCGTTLYRVGELTEKPGLRMLKPNGERCDLVPKGYEH